MSVRLSLMVFSLSRQSSVRPSARPRPPPRSAARCRLTEAAATVGLRFYYEASPAAAAARLAGSRTSSLKALAVGPGTLRMVLPKSYTESPKMTCPRLRELAPTDRGQSGRVITQPRTSSFDVVLGENFFLQGCAGGGPMRDSPNLAEITE